MPTPIPNPITDAEYRLNAKGDGFRPQVTHLLADHLDPATANLLSYPDRYDSSNPTRFTALLVTGANPFDYGLVLVRKLSEIEGLVMQAFSVNGFGPSAVEGIHLDALLRFARERCADCDTHRLLEAIQSLHLLGLVEGRNDVYRSAGHRVIA